MSKLTDILEQVMSYGVAYERGSKTGMEAWVSPKEAEAAINAYIAEQRIDEWNLISETLHSASIVSELHLRNVREDRIAILKKEAGL